MTLFAIPIDKWQYQKDIDMKGIEPMPKEGTVTCGKVSGYPSCMAKYDEQHQQAFDGSGSIAGNEGWHFVYIFILHNQ